MFKDDISLESVYLSEPIPAGLLAAHLVSSLFIRLSLVGEYYVCTQSLPRYTVTGLKI